MSAWIELISKQAELIVLLGAIGFGPAALLRGSAATGSRIALAPVLGLALGSCAMGTAAYVMPMKTAAWVVLLPLACVSLGAGLYARRRAGVQWMTRARAFDVLQVALVLAVVGLTINYPLAERDSLGPLGYTVGDAAGYVAQIDGLEENKLTNERFGPDWDLTSDYAAGYSAGFQQIGADPLAAANDTIFDWGATESQTSLMITLILIGALGLFAAVRGLTEARTPAAVLAGVLLAGPLFFELLIEGSEAALAGLALIVPFALIGALVLRDPCIRNLIVLGILAGGIQTLYPLLVPAVTAWVGLVLLVLLVRAIIRSQLTVNRIVKAIASVAVVAAVGVAMSPVAFSRNVDYWKTVSTTNFLEANNKSFPKYDLPVPVLPGWILQTREFYDLPKPTFDSRNHWPTSVIVPVALIGLMLFGAWRYRRAAVLLALYPGAAALAHNALQHDNCTYCLQRSLLIMGPVSATLVAIGVAGVATWTGAPMRGAIRRLLTWHGGVVAGAAALAIAAIVLVVVGTKTRVMVQRTQNGTFALSHHLRTLLPSLRDRGGVIFLEDPGAAAQGVFELPAVYHAINEQTPNRLAIDTENNDHVALSYMGGPRPSGPRFTPDYRWVATRLADVRTLRRTVARSGPFALQERNGPSDVTIASGVVADVADRDPAGTAWVESPVLKFWISTSTPRPLWLVVELEGARTRVHSPSGARVIDRGPGRLKLCVPIEGRERLRKSRIRLSFKQGVGHPPPDPYGYWLPAESLRLVAVSATQRNCARPAGL